MDEETTTLNTEAEAQTTDSSSEETPTQTTEESSTSTDTPAVTVEEFVKTELAKKAEDSQASQGSQEAEPESTEGAPAETEQDETETEEEEEAPSTEEEPPPFHEHPRWKELVTERDQLKEQVTEFQAPFVEAREKGNVSDSQLKAAVDLIALGNSNPKDAVEALEVYRDELLTQLGEKLPADLQKKVDELSIDVDSAKELARLRVEKETGAATVKAQEQSVVALRAEAIGKATGDWQTSKLAKDPDFKPGVDGGQGSALYELTLAFAGRSWQEQFAKTDPTPEQAVAVFEKAYVAAKGSLGGSAPKPRGRRVMSSSSSSTSSALPPAKTVEEHVNRVLASKEKR